MRAALTRWMLGWMAAVAIAAPVPVAAAQPAAWPSAPIRLIVPYPPGGGTDAFAQPLAAALSHRLANPVVVDHRAGAAGTLGAELAAKSPPDGYTFVLGAVHHAIAVSIYDDLGYDLQRDLAPVTVVASVPNVLVVNPARLDVDTYEQFARHLRAHPGRLVYASAGSGTTHHLSVELYKTLTRTFALHLPYRGAGPALQDLLAGEVDFMFDGLGSSMPHIRAGRLRALAVSSAERSFALPQLPTLAEAGVPGYDARTWYALWAPAGTPAPIVARMQGEVAQALASAPLRERWRELGAEPGGAPPEAMARLVAAEIGKWQRVVKASGARAE
ncbi:MAG TPA: tripartite tricarboxylate transporter substrate binding protein [Burkholderiaceae bacterium]|nr:tripartite tricarboxylate transporter substrate binding protein [Burkholderiaceae bacterium]